MYTNFGIMSHTFLSDIHLDTNINFEIISFGIYENIANIKTNVQ